MNQKAIIIAIVALIIGGSAGYMMGMNRASANAEKMMIDQQIPEGSMTDEEQMMEESASGDDLYMENNDGSDELMMEEESMMEETTEDVMMEQ